MDKHIIFGHIGEIGQKRCPNIRLLRNFYVSSHIIIVCGEVQDLLKGNQSPAAEFNVGLVTAFSAIVREPVDAEIIQKDSVAIQKGIQKDMVSQVCPKLSQAQLTKSAIVLVALMENTSLPISALMEDAGEANRSRFRNNILNPLIEAQLVEPTQKESPQSPKQKYALTDNGTELTKEIKGE